MPKYAEYDPTATPAPVAWVDTDFATYPPPVAPRVRLAVTDAQWTAHMVNPSGWAVTAGALVGYTPPAPVPTLAQRAWAAMAVGLTITSTGTPALSGVYTVDITAQVITSQVTSILLNGTFADGTGSVAWPDTSGALHTFTIAQFKVFATAVAAYVAALFKVINGISVTLPSGSVTIS